MNKIHIKLAQAHENQSKNFDVQREIKEIQEYCNLTEIKLEAESINVMCLRGDYDNFQKATKVVFVFINYIGKTIKELHGDIRIYVDNEKVQFAKTTIDFDENFMGNLQCNEGMLVHLNIPTRGLSEDKSFKTKDLEVQFTDVRVTYVNE